MTSNPGLATENWKTLSVYPAKKGTCTESGENKAPKGDRWAPRANRFAIGM